MSTISVTILIRIKPTSPNVHSHWQTKRQGIWPRYNAAGPPYSTYLIKRFEIKRKILGSSHISVCMNSRTSAICFPLHHALGFITDNECVYCAIRKGFLNTLINQSNLSHLICCAKDQALCRRRLPAEARSPSIWDLWWTKCNWDRLFSEYLGFSLSLSFHLCSILILVCILLLPKE